jgi:hypothetical protein
MYCTYLSNDNALSAALYTVWRLTLLLPSSYDQE